MSMISNMGKFFSTLIPSFKKKELEIDVAFNFEELNTVVKPMYDSADKMKLSGEVFTTTNVHFKRLLNSYSKNTYETFVDTIDNIYKNQEAIEELIASEFHSDNLKIVLDYYKINIIKYIEGLHLFNEYSRRWLNAVGWESADKLSISAPTLKADARFVTDMDNVTAVSAAINMLNQPLAKFINDIKGLKGHQYNENDWEENGSVTSKKLDPFRSNFIPVDWNPIYHIGLAINAWRVSRHRRNQAELNRFQILVQAAKSQKENTKDPQLIESLTKRIDYYSNESNKLSAEIDKMEGRD